MAKPEQLTKDEVWLEKTFHVDLQKFDKSTREGGKGRKDFLLDLLLFHKIWEMIDTKKYDKFTSFKSGNPEIKKIQDSLVTNHKKALAYVKAGDLSKASDAAANLKKAMDDMLQMISQPREGATVVVGQRLGGTVVR